MDVEAVQFIFFSECNNLLYQFFSGFRIIDGGSEFSRTVLCQRYQNLDIMLVSRFTYTFNSLPDRFDVECAVCFYPCKAGIDMRQILPFYRRK